MCIRDRTNESLIEIYEKVLENYSDVSIPGDIKLRSYAENGIFELKHLQPGCEVPEIECEDIDGEVFKLSDYRGKVVLLSFWGDW